MEFFVFAAVLMAQESAPVAAATDASAPAVVEAPAPATVLPPSEKPRVLVLDVKSGDLTPDQTLALTSLITGRAHRFSQAQVVSSQDIRELAQLEAEKQQAGCEDGSSCLAELAGALGAKYVLSTRAGKLGSAYVVSVQVFDAGEGTAAARDTVEAFSLDDLPPKVSPLIDSVLTEVLGAPEAGAAPMPVARVKEDTGPDPLRLGLQIGGGVGVVVGLVSLGLGVTPYVLYEQKKDALQTRTAAYTGDRKQLDAAAAVQKEAADLRALYNNVGRFAVIGGVVLVVAGAGALAAGFFLPPLDELSGGSAP